MADLTRPGKQFDLRVAGFRAAGISCGIKKSGKKDLAVIVSDTPARAAGVFTTNSVKAPPVLLDMKRIGKGLASGIIVNSGNANACTGAQGMKDAEAMASFTEKAFGLRKGSVLVASTGVIGVPLPIGRIEAGMGALHRGLGYDGLHSAAEAIMTTDAFPKKAVHRAVIGGSEIAVAGIAKGAGMICPNMATMLAFFLTDAKVGGRALSSSLKEAVGRSFNSIIVDNDTSTNDTVLVLANGASGPEIKEGSDEHAAFTALLADAATELAHMIVRDGEGATRFVEIEVAGAASEDEARAAARTIAESFLCKTAFFGGDPNWGRIIAAVGRAGVRMKEARSRVSFNGVLVVEGGLDTGAEKEAARAMKARELKVVVGLGAGSRSARVWTSDLTYEYVKINSAYRT